jgi:hypothetical protein
MTPDVDGGERSPMSIRSSLGSLSATPRQPPRILIPRFKIALRPHFPISDKPLGAS